MPNPVPESSSELFRNTCGNPADNPISFARMSQPAGQVGNETIVITDRYCCHKQPVGGGAITIVNCSDCTIEQVVWASPA